MKALRLLLIPILCTAVLSTACSDDPAQTNNTNNTNNTVPPTIDEFIAQVATARATGLCHTAFECPQFTSPQNVAQLGRLGDLDSCIKHFEYQMAQIRFPQIKASVAAGRTKFDAQQATKCLAVLSANVRSCTSSTELTQQACDPAFIATISTGNACTTSTECINGSCTSDGTQTCPGVCIPDTPAAKLGESCADTDCQPGLRCHYQPDSTSPEPTCIQLTFLNKGDTCSDASESTCTPPLICSSTTSICTDAPTYAQLNQPCSTTTHCRAGLACSQLTIQNNDLHGTCLPLRHLDQKCQWTGQCRTGLYCTAPALNIPGTCKRLIQPGQPCNPNPTTESHQCTTGTRCLANPQSTDFTCQDPHQSPKICEI